MNELRYRQAEEALFADAGVQPSERWIELPKIGTTARVLEIGSGPPVLFLHGGPIAAATWAYVAAQLPDLRCLLLDRPGTGLSPAPAAIPRVDELPLYVEALTRDVLDALDLRSASIVGSSLGGYSALRSAASLPDRVDRVVLAGYPAFAPGWRQPSFFTLLRAPLLGRVLLAAPVTRTSARMSLGQLGHKRSLSTNRVPPAMIDWTRAWQRDTDTMRNDGRMIITLGTWRGGFDPSLDLTAEDLAAVSAPVLLLAGTDDPVGGEPEARQLVSHLADASLEVLAGAGHLPWLDDPTWFANHVSSWLGRDERQVDLPRTSAR